MGGRTEWILIPPWALQLHAPWPGSPSKCSSLAVLLVTSLAGFALCSSKHIDQKFKTLFYYFILYWVLVGNSGWPAAHRYLSASASKLLQLKVCSTTHSFTAKYPVPSTSLAWHTSYCQHYPARMSPTASVKYQMVGGLLDTPPLWPGQFHFFSLIFCLFVCVFLRQGLSVWPYREAWKSLCGLGWPENLHVVQADPEFSILLPQPSG